MTRSERPQRDALDDLRDDHLNKWSRDRFQIGQRVRSYDFPGKDSPYVEGWLRAIEPWDACDCGEDHLHIEVELDTWPIEGPCLDMSRLLPADFDNAPRDWVFPAIPHAHSLGWVHMIVVIE